jgi:hypothetical protein
MHKIKVEAAQPAEHWSFCTAIARVLCQESAVRPKPVGELSCVRATISQKGFCLLKNVFFHSPALPQGKVWRSVKPTKYLLMVYQDSAIHPPGASRRLLRRYPHHPIPSFFLNLDPPPL